jgi:hypothetical protein
LGCLTWLLPFCAPEPVTFGQNLSCTLLTYLLSHFHRSYHSNLASLANYTYLTVDDLPLPEVLGSWYYLPLHLPQTQAHCLHLTDVRGLPMSSSSTTVTELSSKVTKFFSSRFLVGVASRWGVGCLKRGACLSVVCLSGVKEHSLGFLGGGDHSRY